MNRSSRVTVCVRLAAAAQYDSPMYHHYNNLYWKYVNEKWEHLNSGLRKIKEKLEREGVRATKPNSGSEDPSTTGAGEPYGLDIPDVGDDYELRFVINESQRDPVGADAQLWCGGWDPTGFKR